MVKRVVDTDFWTDMEVIDHYSPEDKYFYLYLITNGKSSQVGIYSLPIKVIRFETGYSTETIQVLLERFSEKYKQIIYSKETQEVTILNSLKFSILKGGRPVKDLLEKELALVKDATLIQATYENMLQFWTLSKRPFDQTIKAAFENELKNRGLINQQEVRMFGCEESIQSQSQNVIQKDNDNVSHNDNEESGATNREAPDETEVIEHYTNILLKYNPTLKGTIHSSNISTLYYQEIFGEKRHYVDKQLKEWQKLYPTSLILEALSRSVKATTPLSYASTVLENWKAFGITSRTEALRRDTELQGAIYDV